MKIVPAIQRGISRRDGRADPDIVAGQETSSSKPASSRSKGAMTWPVLWARALDGLDEFRARQRRSDDVQGLRRIRHRSRWARPGNPRRRSTRPREAPPRPSQCAARKANPASTGSGARMSHASPPTRRRRSACKSARKRDRSDARSGQPLCQPAHRVPPRSCSSCVPGHTVTGIASHAKRSIRSSAAISARVSARLRPVATPTR